MISDLVGSGKNNRKFDIVIIGGGTLGLPMAVSFAKLGLQTICLESGAYRQDEDIHPLNAVVYGKAVYQGATSGRFRCLGGTSTRWGGALIPFLRSDIEAACWPISYEEILRYKDNVEELFDLSGDDYIAENLIKYFKEPLTYLPRLAKWPRFKNRNVYRLLSKPINQIDNLCVLINATVTDFEVENSRLSKLTARASDGSSVVVEANTFIFTAGAIETTRLLLLLDNQNRQCITNLSGKLGCYFSDHLSAQIGSIKPFNRRLVNEIFGFQFEAAGKMRNLRFELANASSLRDDIRPCFAHIAFETIEGSSFSNLRSLYQHFQRGDFPSPSLIGRLMFDMPWLCEATWWRFIKSRLYYPPNAEITVHLVAEQKPREENRILLSTEKNDLFNKPLAQIDWSINVDDVNNFRKSADALENFWNNSPLSNLGEFIPRPWTETVNDFANSGGIYHPTGSTRMAFSAQDGVVDPDLRVFTLSNVRVVSTSVLPTGGGSNPTMMAAMLAFRCIDNVSAGLFCNV